MPDYQQGKIYKIVSDKCNKVYYGSTALTLMDRWYYHRSNYNAWKKGKQYPCSIFKLFDEYGVNNFKIELIENYPCGNSEELCIREQYYLDNNECVNEYRAYLSLEDTKKKRMDYWNENREYFAKKQHENYEKNKQQILEKMREKITCDCGLEVSRSSLAKHLKTKRHAKLLNLTI